MYGAQITFSSFWWIVPLVMMLMCFFMMRKRRGSMMCGFHPRGLDGRQFRGSATAREILDKRYASGAITRDEYEEIKKTLAHSADAMEKNEESGKERSHESS